MSVLSRPFSRLVGSLLLAALVICIAGAKGGAAKGGPIRRLKLDPDAPRIDLFAAIADGTIEVRVSPRDETEANVFLTNTSDKPVTVVAPQAVAAAHILKQFNPGGNAGNPFGQNPQGQNDPNGNAQSLGGQFGPSGAQGNSGASQFFGNGSFFFSVPPDKTVQVALHSVCLDYGKRTPVPAMKYELRRLEDHTDNPALVHLFQSRDMQKTDRKVIQAAAWHLSNGLTFAQMSTLMGNNGVPLPMFTAEQLKAAQELVSDAKKNPPPKAEERTATNRR